MNIAELTLLDAGCPSVVCEDEYITIKVKDGYDYLIALSRIDTPEKLSWWILHLLEKPWFTKGMCSALIYHSTAAMGIDITGVLA